MKTRPFILSVWIGVLSLTGVASASGQEVPPLEELKQSVLETSVQVDAALRSVRWGGAKPLEVYLACEDGASTIVSAKTITDEINPSEITFSHMESAALSGGGWYSIGAVRRGGSIHVQMAVVYRSAKTLSAPRHISVDATVEDIATDSSLVVVLEPHVLGAPTLRAMQVRPKIQKPGVFGRLLSRLPEANGIQQQFVAGGPNDPIARQARFLESTRDYLAAATLLRVEGRDPEREANPEYAAALSKALLDYGLPTQAKAILPVDRDTQMLSVIDLRLELGNRYFRRSEFLAADEVLAKPPPRREMQRLLAWQDLKSQNLMAQGRMADAVAVLSAVEPHSDYAGYVRYYNLGIALAGTGKLAQGLTILDRIGSLNSVDTLMMTLIDHANLVAGIHFLRGGQGATALPLLERIRDQGPDASRAILDLGWAYLAPAGSEQIRTRVGDERMVGVPPESADALGSKGDQNVYQRFNLDPFQRAKVDKSEDGKLRHALSIWAELADRPVPDDAVIEAMLAIASKLREAGVNQRAADYYERAITAITRSLGLVGEAETYVSGDRADIDLYAPNAGERFDRELHKLPPRAIAYYLSSTLAQWSFRERLADYRDAVELAGEVDTLRKLVRDERDMKCSGHSESPEDQRACEEMATAGASLASLDTSIAAANTGFRRELPRPLLEELNARRAWLNKLLRDARLNLARVYDAAATNSP